MKKSVNFRRRPKSPTAKDLLATFRRLGMSDDEIAAELQKMKAAEQGVQSDLKPCPHGDLYLIGDPPFCTECVLDEEAASSR